MLVWKGNLVPLSGVKDQDDAAVDHIPLIEGHFVDVIGDESVLLDAERAQHGLLPETAATLDCGDRVDDTEGQDTFDRTRDYTEDELSCEILIPSLDVEG